VFLDIDNSKELNGVKVRKTDSEGYLPFHKVVENETVQQTCFMCYTTPSHTDDWNRFRMVYCLPEVVTDVERYKHIIKAFVDRTGADEACKSPVHIYYGNTQAEMHPFGAVLTDDFVQRLLHRTDELRKEERKATNHLNTGVAPEHVAEMLACIPVKISYDEWVRIISGVASRFDEDTTVRLIENWSAGKQGEVRYKVRHRLQSIGIGSVIYIAKQYGYKPNRELYADSVHEEAAGVIFKNVQYRLTQSGNAERFVDTHKHHVRYCVEQTTWYIWDGKRLAADHSGAVTQLAKQTFRDIIKEAALVPKIPLPPFMHKLQNLMAGGIPLGTILTMGSMSGAGKSTISEEMVYYWVFNSPHKIGIVSLESDCAQYGTKILSRHISKKIDLIDDSQLKVNFLNTDDVQEKANELFRNNDGTHRFHLIDERDGGLDSLKSQIMELIVACDCRVIILDPLTDVLDGMSNEEQSVFMKWLKGMVKSHQVTFILISHVRKSSSGAKANSTGADLHEEDFMGSSSIFKSSACNLLFTRNKEHEDDVLRNVTTMKMTKCRWTGRTAPIAGQFFYSNETHTLSDYEDWLLANPQEF